MSVRKGNQEPTFSTRIENFYSDGDEVVDLMRDYCVEFIPSQEYELRVFRMVDDDGRAAYKTICISKPRQNGKSFGARSHAAVTAAVDGKRVLYSAHHGKTVRKMFKELCVLFTETDLAEMLKPGSDGIYKAAGSEGIYLTNGGLIEFQTRTASAARGETYDLIIIDEAQELTDEQLEAIKPTTLASDSGDPQIIFLGTPPGPKCPGTVFREYHRKAHANPEDCGFIWLEWSVDDIPDMEDRSAVLELAYMTNPMLGYRIREDVMMDAIATATSPDGFAREYLGWWSKSSSIAVLPESAWSACKTDTPQREGLTCYAVKFNADGSRGTLSAAILQSDDTVLVVAIDSQDCTFGVKWVADWLIEHWREAAQIVIDGKAHSEDVKARLVAAKVAKAAIVTPGAQDVVSACSMFEAGVRERSVAHTDQPALNHSALNTCKRKIGNAGGWAFDAIGDSDETLVESCALAYWQARVTKRNPSKKMRIG